MLNIAVHKVFRLLSTLPMEIGNTLVIFKTVYILFLVKRKGKEKPFLNGKA